MLESLKQRNESLLREIYNFRFRCALRLYDCLLFVYRQVDEAREKQPKWLHCRWLHVSLDFLLNYCKWMHKIASDCTVNSEWLQVNALDCIRLRGEFSTIVRDCNWLQVNAHDCSWLHFILRNWIQIYYRWLLIICGAIETDWIWSQ